MAETSCRVTVNQKPTVNLELDKSASDQVTTTVGKPEILTGRCGGRVVLKASSEAVPECEPHIWFISSKPVDTGLPETIRARVTINESYSRTSHVTGTPVVQQTYLTISNLQLTDSGDIGVRAENCVGSAQAAIRLVLSDRPQPPESVHVASTRGPDWIEVCWMRPASDGGSKLTGYVIERRVVSAGTEPVPIRSTEWTQIGKTGPYEDRLRIRDSLSNTVYSFRVSAQNDIGTSEPTEIETPYQLKSLTG